MHAKGDYMKFFSFSLRVLFIVSVGMLLFIDACISFVIIELLLHTFLFQAFHVHEFLHTVWVLEPKLHADEGLSALQTELVPGFGPGQQV